MYVFARNVLQTFIYNHNIIKRLEIRVTGFEQNICYERKSREEKKLCKVLCNVEKCFMNKHFMNARLFKS